MKIEKLYLASLLQDISRRDDEQAFSKLFKMMYERLVNFSKHYVQSRETAEEIVSDIFVKVWNSRRELSHILNIEAYLYVAVKNQSLNNLGKKPYSFVEISETSGLDISQLINAFDPERELEVQELQHHINIAIDTLPSQCRTVFKMIKEDGFRYKEVAAILNVSPRTVETQLVRALKRLDIALSQYASKRMKRSGAKSKSWVERAAGQMLNLFF